jgi:hypothetical protein
MVLNCDDDTHDTCGVEEVGGMTLLDVPGLASAPARGMTDPE